MFFAALAATSPASAYETDQLTRRGEPLADSLKVANAEVNIQLAAAVAETNAALGCHAPLERTRRHLATQIHARLARSTPVNGRPGLESLGYGAYAAFLETGPVPRREFTARTDLYGSVTALQSPAIAAVGVCSTIRLAGVLMGTDKADHFFDQGYDYLLASGWGLLPARGVAWGIASERGTYGLLTSNVFSFADLHANRRGFEFYSRLLRPRSELHLDRSGCVVVARKFDWSDWVDDGFDEVLNPSTRGVEVERAVHARLVDDRQAVCADYQTWKVDAASRHSLLRRLLRGDAGLLAPPRPAFPELSSLCGDSPPTVLGPFVEAPSTPPFPRPK